MYVGRDVGADGDIFKKYGFIVTVNGPFDKMNTKLRVFRCNICTTTHAHRLVEPVHFQTLVSSSEKNDNDVVVIVNVVLNIVDKKNMYFTAIVDQFDDRPAYTYNQLANI